MHARPSTPHAGQVASPSPGRRPRPLGRLAFALCMSIGALGHGAGLDDPVQASWTRVPLRDWADRATRLAGMPVIVDRRLDPTKPITLDARGEPLGAVLERVAATLAAVVEPLASTIRIVPADRRGAATAAEAARTAAVARLPARIRTALARRAAWSWPAAARPRDLVAAAAVDAGLTVTGLDDIPHDHLAAASLPPLTLAERLDLVLANYDLRIDWTATGGVVVPLGAGVEGQAAARPAAVPRRRVPRGPAAAREVFSLRLAAPLDQAIAALAGRLGLTPEIDAASLAARGIAAGEIVRVDIQDASRDELLDAVVKPLGLSWAIDDTRLRVFAADAPAAQPAAATAVEIGRLLAARVDLPSVHMERPEIDAALAAAGIDDGTRADLWREVDRARLPGVGSPLDTFLFLTRDPRWLALRPRFEEFLVLPGITTITPAIAAAIAPYEGYVSLPDLHELAPESAAALAAFGGDSWSAGVELPGVATLSPESAAALAACRALLVLPGLRELSPEAAQAIARHEGVGLVIGGIRRLPADVAERLGGCQSTQGLLLPDLVALDSITLARRLSRQDNVFLPAVRSLEPEIAATLAGRSHRIALDGLEELDTATATALTTHPGELSLRGLRRISSRALKLLQARDDVALPPAVDLVVFDDAAAR